MSRVLADPIPAEVVDAQRRAAIPPPRSGGSQCRLRQDPRLTQRVLRLLLGDVRPEEVLCITYTKAAAAEMRERIAARLARWALLDDDALVRELKDITGDIPTADERRRARSLFAHALDTPGGLRIQTIHAFCESVLHRFPVEAGVPFDFTVLEDHQREAMVLRARETVLAGGLAGSGEARAVETLFGMMSDFLITEAIDESFASIRALRRLLADRAGATAARARRRGAGAPTAAALRHAIETETLLAPGDCRELVRCWRRPAQVRRFADMLARVNLDRPSCDDLLDTFLTGEGSLRHPDDRRRARAPS